MHAPHWRRAGTPCWRACRAWQRACALPVQAPPWRRAGHPAGVRGSAPEGRQQQPACLASDCQVAPLCWPCQGLLACCQVERAGSSSQATRPSAALRYRHTGAEIQCLQHCQWRLRLCALTHAGCHHCPLLLASAHWEREPVPHLLPLAPAQPDHCAYWRFQSCCSSERQCCWPCCQWCCWACRRQCCCAWSWWSGRCGRLGVGVDELVLNYVCLDRS